MSHGDPEEGAAQPSGGERGSLAIDDDAPRSVDPGFLQRVVDVARDWLQRPELDVSLLLTDDESIAELHGRFLDDPTPTDVITFPLDDGSVDLVVSVECADRTAAASGHEPDAEVALYVVHGILHACGHDDIEEEDRAAMRRAEREILARLGLAVRAVDGDGPFVEDATTDR